MRAGFAEDCQDVCRSLCLRIVNGEIGQGASFAGFTCQSKALSGGPAGSGEYLTQMQVFVVVVEFHFLAWSWFGQYQHFVSVHHAFLFITFRICLSLALVPPRMDWENSVLAAQGNCIALGDCAKWDKDEAAGE